MKIRKVIPITLIVLLLLVSTFAVASAGAGDAENRPEPGEYVCTQITTLPFERGKDAPANCQFELVDEAPNGPWGLLN